MKATIQIAAALLLLGGSAQAQSDHIGTNWQYPSTKAEIYSNKYYNKNNAKNILLFPKNSAEEKSNTIENRRTLWGR